MWSRKDIHSYFCRIDERYNEEWSIPYESIEQGFKAMDAWCKHLHKSVSPCIARLFSTGSADVYNMLDDIAKEDLARHGF